MHIHLSCSFTALKFGKIKFVIYFNSALSAKISLQLSKYPPHLFLCTTANSSQKEDKTRVLF